MASKTGLPANFKNPTEQLFCNRPLTEMASQLPSLTAPAQFLGIQPGFENHPSVELYVLLSPVAHHPVGSTVSRQTLERHGFSPHPRPSDDDKGVRKDKVQPGPAANKAEPA
jgi:hypothetical protein